MDDEDEADFARGFLEAVNDPSMVGRRRHPNGWGGYRKRQVREAMIVNGGATAMKGIDLVTTADLMPSGTTEQVRAREVARRNAFETIRNWGRTITAVLDEHDAQVAFQQAVIGMVFESVWEMIPAGGALATGAAADLPTHRVPGGHRLADAARGTSRRPSGGELVDGR